MRLAVPALGSIAAEPLYTIADTAIVGHLGCQQLDALAISASILAIVAWLAIFLSTATTTEVASRAARGDHEAAGRAVGAAYTVAAGWGVVTAAILAVAAPLAAGLLGAHGAVAAGATSYLRISALGLPFLYASYAGNGHRTGLQDTRTPLAIAVAANTLNVILEVVLVFGVHKGLNGSAWGTVIAQIAAAAAYATASWRTDRRWPSRSRARISREPGLRGRSLAVRQEAVA